MVDDQDRCKWVNISSGISSPGWSQIKGRKTVVVVDKTNVDIPRHQ